MKKSIFATLVILVMSADAAAAARIQNLEGVAIPARSDGSPFSLSEVQALIVQGCTEREWIPIVVGDAVVTCEILVRGKHFVKVEIPFTTTDYSIFYLDSDNMDYNPSKQSIHRKYNGWVANLSHVIDRQFREASVRPEGNAGKAGKSAEEDRYEALLKLGELRDKGLITAEEFEAEKQKLLSDD